MEIGKPRPNNEDDEFDRGGEYVLDLTLPIVHNVEKNRFEVAVEGGLAMLEYVERNGRIVFTHTEVPPVSRGRGIGEAVVRFGLEYAREKGMTVVPLCPFVADYIRAHPAYGELVEGYAERRR